MTSSTNISTEDGNVIFDSEIPAHDVISQQITELKQIKPEPAPPAPPAPPAETRYCMTQIKTPPAND
jgi:hypothetical protein